MPHLYQSVWTEARDDYEDWVVLTPISDEAFRLAMEDWRIWLRWEAAYHEGRVALDTRPALPEDAARKAQLAPLLAELLVADRTSWVAARGVFRPSERILPVRRGLPPMEVAWTPVDVEIVEDRLVARGVATLDG